MKCKKCNSDDLECIIGTYYKCLNCESGDAAVTNNDELDFLKYYSAGTHVYSIKLPLYFYDVLSAYHSLTIDTVKIGVEDRCSSLATLHRFHTFKVRMPGASELSIAALGGVKNGIYKTSILKSLGMKYERHE